MPPRPFARWLAPSALAAALLAVLVLVTTTLSGEDSEPRSSGATPPGDVREAGSGKDKSADRDDEPTSSDETDEDTSATDTSATDTSTTPDEESYTVRAGDTLSSISSSTGVSVEDIERLNPGIDSQSLTVGQAIKLSE